MNSKTILIFAYYSFKDPVFQSAVLPYFINFPDKGNYRFILLTFEQKRYKQSTIEKGQTKVHLLDHNIIWYPNTWHSGFIKIIKKGYDLIFSISKTLFLIRKYKVDAVYSEGFPGAIIGNFVTKLAGKPHIIHTFEPHADYMIESGIWKKSDWETKVQKHFEKVVAKNAFAIMTATQGMIEKLREITNAKLYRVPSCVDLDHFKFIPESREEIRKIHGLKDNEIVIVYLGKLGGMYMEEELFDFFKALKKTQLGKDTFKFMVLTVEPIEKVVALIEQSKISKKDFVIKNLTREQVPHYLSAADVAFCGIRPISSRKYSSPIKNGEYWACGLPIVIPKGISESYLFVEQKDLGWCLPSLAQKDYEEIREKILDTWNKQQQIQYRKNARDFAEKDRNVSSYKKLYHQVFQNLMLLYFSIILSFSSAIAL